MTLSIACLVLLHKNKQILPLPGDCMPFFEINRNKILCCYLYVNFTISESKASFCIACLMSPNEK